MKRVKKSGIVNILAILSSIILISLFSISIVAAVNDTSTPDTDITHIKELGESEWQECVNDNTYVTYTDIVIKGVSTDAEHGNSKLKSLQYLRDKWNWVWHDATALNPPIDSVTESWETEAQLKLPTFTEGWHRVCGRATDGINQENAIGTSVDNVPDDDCCTFCIDTQEPEKVQNVHLSNPSECVSNWVNEAPEFSWTAEDEGCADIDYYEVKVYYSDDELYYSTTTEENSITIKEPEVGENYYIKVRAVDKAGNLGEWSKESEDVYYDNIAPEMEFIGPSEEEWLAGDFQISETESDNIELWKCFYKIENDGVVDWTETECNANLTIDVSEHCPIDGIDSCVVWKKAVDKACNENSGAKRFDLENNPPYTEKIVGEPKYPGPNILWPLVSWFIKPETTITLVCHDDGIGCNKTYYKMNGGNWSEYNYEPISLGEEDGVYYFEYYSVDKWGREEQVKNETDKIDTQAPTTNKIYGEPYIIGQRVIQDVNVMLKYISPKTNITLIAADSEVGVDKTYYQILIPDVKGKYTEWYGIKKERWYENEEECLIENCPLIEGEEYCGGEPTKEACSNYNKEQCLAIEGCNWTEERNDSLQTAAYEEPGICRGAPLSCEAVADNWPTEPKEKCEETLGCEWVVEEDEYERCENCTPTHWNIKWDYMESELCSLNEEWCLYKEPVNIPQECDHKICYFSVDYLKNKEEPKCQVFSVDTIPPEISVLNPNWWESKIKRCVQSIVVRARDSKSGVKRVWAELYDNNETLVRSAEMPLTVYGTYEALMDKQLPAGEYILKIKAEDNVGNIGETEIEERLKEGIFVEYVEDPICKINPEVGGNCNFIFHVCMRNSDSIKMWMDKLGQVVTPAMMNATISKGENSAYVALLDKGIETESLKLSEETINGRTSFNLALNIPSNVSSMIGAGAHKLDYLIRAYSQELPD